MTPVEFTRTSNACGFPVLVTSSGYFIEHQANAGNKTIFVLNWPRLTTTITNPANGISLSSPSPSQEFSVVYSDGSSTDATNGLTFRWVLPGSGLIAADAGRFEQTIAADGTSTVTVHGQDDAFLPCSILAGG